MCGVIDFNEWKTQKRHECANMGQVKRLKLWWQLYVVWLPVRDLENFRPMDFCSTECTDCGSTGNVACVQREAWHDWGQSAMNVMPLCMDGYCFADYRTLDDFQKISLFFLCTKCWSLDQNVSTRKWIFTNFHKLLHYTMRVFMVFLRCTELCLFTFPQSAIYFTFIPPSYRNISKSVCKI